MKTAIIRALGSVCLAAVSLLAQDSLNVTIPFDFTVGAKSFSAGDYTVRPAAPSVVTIRSVDGRSAAMAMTFGVESTKTPGKPKLVFHRYGDQYFLSQIWDTGSRGKQLQPSAAEKELIAKTRSVKPVTLVASAPN